MREVFLQPVHAAFKELVNADMFSRLMAARVVEAGGQLDVALLDEVEQKAIGLLRAVKQITRGAGDDVAIAHNIRRELEIILQLPVLSNRYPWPESRQYASAVEYLLASLDDSVSTWGCMLGWCFIHLLGKAFQAADWEQQSRSWIDEWLLGKIIAGVLQDLGAEGAVAWRAVALIKALTAQCWFKADLPHPERPGQVLTRLLQDSEVQQLLQVNRYQGVVWFNKEAFEQWVWWLMFLGVVEAGANLPADLVTRTIVERFDLVTRLLQAEARSGYQLEKLIEALEPRF